MFSCSEDDAYGIHTKLGISFYMNPPIRFEYAAIKIFLPKDMCIYRYEFFTKFKQAVADDESIPDFKVIKGGRK